MGSSFDLKARARRAMVEAGFHPDFSQETLQELPALDRPNGGADSPARDLRSLLWSSIDNEHSRDLDQVEYVERQDDHTLKLLVGIADVDWRVRHDSAIDSHASAEATSVYTGVRTFPMLPERLSTDLTSLVQDADRRAIVIEMSIGTAGEVVERQVYLAWVHNRAKLSYPSVGAWLDGRGPIPPLVPQIPGLEDQLRLQLETSARLRGLRHQQGALTFGSFEARPVVENDQVKDLVLSRHNAAEDVIETFMVAANVAMAQHLKENGSLSIRRVVRKPRRWERIQAIALQFGVNLPDIPDPRALCRFLEARKTADPEHFPDLSLSIVKLLGPGEYVVEPPGQEQEGHFGLAVNDYTHSTAPNRRYPDLVTQRLLKTLGRPAPYSQERLSAIAAHCTEREDAARRVERLMRKVIAADLLRNRIGETFDAIVTGASSKGTYVRLRTFPAEGKVVGGTEGIDVGDRVKVRLSAVDVEQGFIDFIVTGR